MREQIRQLTQKLETTIVGAHCNARTNPRWPQNLKQHRRSALQARTTSQTYLNEKNRYPDPGSHFACRRKAFSKNFSVAATSLRCSSLSGDSSVPIRVIIASVEAACG